MRSVLVLEDDEATRARLCRTLSASADLSIAWEGDRGGAALAWLARGLPVDVALVGLGLPDMNGQELVRAIARVRPAVAILVLTVFDDADSVRTILRCGANGYLTKPVSRGLSDAVLAAASGGSPISPHVARIILDAWRDGGADGAPPDALTQREVDVLSLLARGATYAAVAGALGLGLGTVQGYVKSIYGKLHVHSKSEARACARRMGLLQ